MRTSDWFKALRNLAANDLPASPAARRRRQLRQPTRLSAEIQRALQGPVRSEVLEDRTLLSVTTGSDSAAILPVSPSGNSIIGTAAADTLYASPGNDTIDGGFGTDTAVFSGNYSAYTFFFEGTAPNYTLVVTDSTGTTGVDRLRNVELLSFPGTGTIVRVAGFGTDYNSDGMFTSADIAAVRDHALANEVILIQPGTYDLSAALSLDYDGMAVRGMSAGHTILQRSGATVVSFSGRTSGTLSNIGIKGGSAEQPAVIESTGGSPAAPNLRIESAVIDDAGKTTAEIETTGSQIISIAVTSGTLQVTVGTGAAPIELSSPTRPVTITGGSGDDTLIVDFGSFAAAPPTIIFDGGAGGNDVLQVIGATGDSIIYSPSADTSADNKKGVITYNRFGGGSGTLHFSNLEPIDATVPGGTVEVRSIAGGSAIAAGNEFTIANGFATNLVQTAVVITGFTNNKANVIESIHVFNTANLIIDTSGITNSEDDLIITAANATAAGISSLTFNTGANTGDSIVINGPVIAAGGVSFTSPTIHFTSSTSDVTSASGNVSITGGAGANGGSGITAVAGVVINAGSGTITIDGEGKAVNFWDGASPSRLTTTSAAADAITVRDASSLRLGNVTAAGTIRLGVAGQQVFNYTQTVGTAMTATNLSIAASGVVSLTGNNSITNLGPVSVSAGGFSYREETGDLNVSAAISVAGSISLVVSAGPLLINADVTSNGSMLLEGAGLSTGGVVIDATGGTIEISGAQEGPVILHAGSEVRTTSAASNAIVIHKGHQPTGTAVQLGALTASQGTVVLGVFETGQGNDINGAITQAGGIITAQNLAVANQQGSVTLTRDNRIGTLKRVDRGGSFRLRDAEGGLIVEGPVDRVLIPDGGGNINNDVEIVATSSAVPASGVVAINGIVRTNGTGNISITGIGITAGSSGQLDATGNSAGGTGTVTLDASGAAIDMHGSSRIISGNTSGAAVTIRDATTVALGNITAASGSVILGIAADITGAVTQNGSSAIATNTLTISTASSVNLPGAGNLLTTLGVTSTVGGLTLNDSAGGITISGPVSDSTGGVAVTTVGGITISGSITASAGTVALDTNSSGAINGSSLITGSTITLDSISGIGNTTPLELSGTSLSITTAGGAINVDNDNSTTDVTVTSLATGNGANITFEQFGGRAVSFTSVTTTNAGAGAPGSDNITLRNTGGSLTATAVTAAGQGDILLETLTSGHIILGSVTATADHVTVTAAGNISDDTNDGLADVTSDTVTLTAGGAIGSATNSVDLAVTTVTSAVAGNGGINLNTLNAAGYSAITANSSGNVILSSAGTLTLPAFSSPGNVTITTTAGNLSIAGITTTSGSAILTSAGSITQTAGSIAAAFVSLDASAGIGSSGTPLSTSGSGLTLAANTNSGGIFVANSGGLIVGSVIGGRTGLTTSTGDISIVATGPLNINAAVASNNGGNITLTASGALAADDLTISSTVTSSGGNGNITLNAGDSIIQNAAGDLAAAGSGAIAFNAGQGTTTGAISQTNGATAVTATGLITLNADGNITIANLETQNTTAAAINITTTAGAVLDGGDEHVDIIASGAVTSGVTISAANGIGSTNALETTVGRIAATNSISGNIGISETNALILGIGSTGIDAGAGNFLLTMNGGIVTQTSGAGILAGALNLAGSGSYTLTEATNDVLTIAGNVTGSVSYTETNELTVGTVAAAGLTTNGGNVVISTAGALTVSQPITTTAAIDSGTASGIIDLEASGEIIIFAQLNSTGAANNAGLGSAAGDISIFTSGTAAISIAADITASGGNSTADGSSGGAAGNITIDTDASPITLFGTAITAAGGTGDTQGAGADITFADYVEIVGGTVTVSTGATAGNITFFDTVDGDQTLSLTAGTGNITFLSAIGEVIALASVSILSAADVTAIGTLRTSGDFLQSAGTGTTTINGTSGTGIGGTLSLTTDTVVFNSGTLTSVGAITVHAENAVSINAGSIDSGDATVSISANQDGAGTEAFTMASGSSITTTSNALPAISIRVNSAAGGSGDAELGLLSAVNGQVTVNVQQTSSTGGGAIIDANAGSASITAATALLLAATGIGNIDAINTQVGTIAFANSITGNVQLNQLSGAGGFTIGTVGTQTFSANTASGSPNQVVLTSGGPIAFAHNVTSAGDLTAAASDSDSAADDDISVSAGVTVLAAHVVFNAGDSIMLAGSSRVEATAPGGDVTFRSDVGSADTTGSMSLDGIISAAAGTVTLNLNSAGAAIQGSSPASIIASELLLLSSASVAADFSLDSADNQIGTLAAATSGDVVLRDTDGGLIIGSVGSTSGISTGTGSPAPASGGLVTINVPNGTIIVSGAISTVPPASGGTASINIAGSVVVNNSIRAEGGDVTLNGDTGANSDILINFALATGGNLTLSAPRDVLINATVATTGSGTISLIGDGEPTPDGLGGVLITAAGQVSSAGNVVLRGSAGQNTSFTDASGTTVAGFTPMDPLASLAVQVNPDAVTTTTQVFAAGSITIDSHAATGNSDVVINGVLSTGAGGTVSITADDRAAFGTAGDISAGGAVVITAGGGIFTSGDITTTNDNVQYASAVTLENAVAIDTGSGPGNVIFSSTVNGTATYGEDLSVTAGTGSVTFNAAIGNSVRLGDIVINSLAASSRFNSTVSADSLITDSVAPYNSLSVANVTFLNGTVTTRGHQTYNDNLRIDSSLTLQIDDSTALGTGSITIRGTTDAVDGNEILSLDSGRVGTVNSQNIINVDGAIGSLTPIYALVIVDSNGADFAAAITTQTTSDSAPAPDNTDQTRHVRILASAGNGGGTTNGEDANVRFHGPIITNALLAASGANAGYNLYLFGDGTNVRVGTLENSGDLQFGDNSADSLIFRDGITATGQFRIFLLGIPRTYGAPVILGDSDTTVYVYPGTSLIDTTFGASGLSGANPAGADITIGGNLEGTSDAGSKSVEFRAGTAGDVTILGDAGAAARLGTLLVTSANDVTVNNVTAQLFLQTTGTGTTTTNGTIDTNAGTTVETDNFAPANVVTGTGTRPVTLGVNLLTTHIVINGLITTTGGGVQLRAMVGAATSGPPAVPVGVGVVTLNNNGRIVSDLDVILEGGASTGITPTTGIVINALGTAVFGAPGSGDVLTGTQRDFVTTSDAPVEFRSHITMVASPNLFADRFIVSTTGTVGVPGGSTAKTAPILFAGTVDANYSDLDIRSGHSNVNFRDAVDEVQRLFLRLNDTTVATTATTTTTVTFVDNLTVEWLLPTAGHYNVDIIGTTTILSENVIQYYLPNDTVFNNTGRTQLGNGSGDTITAFYGLDTTASSHTTMAGTTSAGYEMNLSPIVLPANESATIYTRSSFDVFVEADAITGASVSQGGNSTLVLGTATSRTCFTFAGNVTVNTLSTTLSTSAWDLFIQGALDITGVGITTLNNRGLFQMGSAGGTNQHDLTGGLNTSGNLSMVLAGRLLAGDSLTLTGGLLSVLSNTTTGLISTSSGTITLANVSLADGVDLTIGSAANVPIITRDITGVGGGTSSSIRLHSLSTVTINGSVGNDIGTVQLVNSSAATFNQGVGLSKSSPVNSLVITQSTSTTFVGQVFARAIQADAGAGNISFPAGACVSGATSLMTTGLVTFGALPNPDSEADAFEFLGGLTRTGGATTLFGVLTAANADVQISGNLTTSGTSSITAGSGLISLGAVLIGSNTTLSIGLGSSGPVSISSVQPATVATGTSLRLGSSGTTTVSGTVSGLSTLQVDRGNVTFNGAVGTSGTRITTVSLMAGPGTTTFNDNFFATSVSAASGAGAVSFLGTTTSVTNAATFSNSGMLTLGNSAADTLTFSGGLTANSTAVQGTLATVSSPISLGSLAANSAILTTGSNSSSSITVGALSGTGVSLTAGSIQLTGTVSAGGAINLSSAGNVTLSKPLSSAGSLTITSSGTASIAGGSTSAVTVNAASITLTTTPLLVTNATSLTATGAVTLQSDSGINTASSLNAGTIAINAGAAGFSQAANAGIYTLNNGSSAISVLSGGAAAIGTLVAGTGAAPAAVIQVTASAAVTDSNDPTIGSAVNNVRAGTFLAAAGAGFTVGTPTNPIEYHTTNVPILTGRFLVSTAPTGATLRRFDFSRTASAVLTGTTGIYMTTYYDPTTARSSSNGSHFGFTRGQFPSITNGTSTTRSSYNFYIDSLVQTSRVSTLHIDTDKPGSGEIFHVRVYFGSAAYATNTLVTVPGSSTALASSGALNRGDFVRSAVFTLTTDSVGTISLEFKRPTTATTYWGVAGLEIASVLSDLPAAELPQMLSDVSFDQEGLSAETRAAIAANGLQGRILDESAILAVRDQAIAAWARTGLSPEKLQVIESTPVVIGDLSADGQLGLAKADHIVLDDDAMGLGWFIDGSGDEVPPGMIDLLTVLTHEFGHRLGFDDLDAERHPGHIMAESLRPGERRVAAHARVVAHQQPIVEPTIDIPAESQRADSSLSASCESADTSAATLIAPPRSAFLRGVPTGPADRRTLQRTSVRGIQVPLAVTEESAGGLSLLDDLFAEFNATLEALN
jgi:hypothetical protein